jgi:hypothetical protein
VINDLPRIWKDDTSNQLKERGFPNTVAADESERLSTIEFERNVSKGRVIPMPKHSLSDTIGAADVSKGDE